MGHALAAAEEALAALAAVPAHELGNSESVERLHRLKAQAEAIAAGATAAFDSSGAWADDRAKSAAAWVSARCRVSRDAASRTVKLGRALRHMPEVERAWRAGLIHGDHVQVLDRARTTTTAEAFADGEADLVEVARTARWHRFVRHVQIWRQLHDPDRAERDAAKLRDERRLHLSQSFEGQWFLDGILDPIGGTIVSSHLGRIERELFQRDWREAKDRLGRDPLPHELSRTPAQRRADALVEMAMRAATAPKDGRRPAPLFTVLVDYETFLGRVCQLANGTVVTPGSLVPYLDEAYVQRVVFEGGSRVIDVGRKRRLFEGATRDAVQARDLFECFDDLCDETGEHLQVDHAIPWAVGGPTTHDNGRPACGHHNRRRHGRGPRGP